MLPVNSRWSKGRLVKAAPTAASPSMTATRSAGNTSAQSSRISALVRGVNSLGLIITWLPAAIASTSGMIASWNG